MICRWLISSSLLLPTLIATLPASAPAGQVSGRIELSDSHDPAVRNRRDYSGVVISKAMAGSSVTLLQTAPPVQTKKAVILQKDKMFSPHVLAIPIGSSVDFPNADPIFHNAFSSYNGQIFDVGLYPPGTSRSVHFAREGVVRVFCNIHSSMSAMIVVLATPYYATTGKDGSFSIPDVPPGDYAMTVVHEKATEAALAAAARRVSVGADNVTLPQIVISEAGFLSIPHKNKYGRPYSPEPPSEPVYPGDEALAYDYSTGAAKTGGIRASRLSLLWKILLSTSIALTVLFGVIGAIVQNTASRALETSVEQEVQASFQAYDSLWRSRAEMLASVSLVMSKMSDVRAAFGTGDAATIRDTASDLWKDISSQKAFFLVADPQGRVITSLGGLGAGSLGAGSSAAEQYLPVVRQALAAFPRQSSGFMMAGPELYQIAVTPVYVQSGNGLGLLDVLVAGYAVDRDVVRSLRESTGGSDFCFLANGQVVASTLDPATIAGVRAAAAVPEKLQRISAGGAEYTMLSTALTGIDGQPLGELRILRSFENARQNIARLGRNIVLIWLCAVLVGLLLTYSLARRILEPVNALDRGAAEVARGNYDYRVRVGANGLSSVDELGRLAEAFDAMCAAIQESRRELIRQERIATIGRLSTSIVHDLRNPLAAIYGGAEMLMDGQLSSPQVQRLAGNIYRSSRRMQELLQELVDTGRGRSTSAEMCRLREVVVAAYEVFAIAADAQSVSVRIEVPEDIELPLERARMERVFLNLIDNALGVMPAGGRLEIGAEANDQSVLVRVEDTGPGIAPQVRPELFQPFATAGKKNGVGLGLAFSHQTVLDHGGELWVDSAPGPGAKFFLRLPLTLPWAATDHAEMPGKAV